MGIVVADLAGRTCCIEVVSYICTLAFLERGGIRERARIYTKGFSGHVQEYKGCS
jgi:hypothetical protein